MNRFFKVYPLLAVILMIVTSGTTTAAAGTTATAPFGQQQQEEEEEQQNQQEQTQVFVIGSDKTIHEIPLLATKQEQGAELKRISDFRIEPNSVVQVNQGRNIVVVVNPVQDEIQKVKVRNADGQLTDLNKVQGSPNTYSLAGFLVGAYLLDVIVKLSDNLQGAYETVLLILPENEQPIIINSPIIIRILQTIKTTIVNDDFDDDDEDDDGPNTTPTPSPIPGPTPTPEPKPGPDDDCLFNPSLPKCKPPPGQVCPEGFLMNEDGNCFPEKPCPAGYEKLEDDETGTCHPIVETTQEVQPTPVPQTEPSPEPESSSAELQDNQGQSSTGTLERQLSPDIDNEEGQDSNTGEQQDQDQTESSENVQGSSPDASGPTDSGGAGSGMGS